MITKPAQRGHDVYISSLKKGECFGEMSLFTGERPSARVKSFEDVATIYIDKDLFYKFILSYPNTGLKITTNLIKILSKRLKERTEDVASLINMSFNITSPKNI
jgi:CRP-like cAMP-binding protein